jgi:hypothetical protein
LLLQVKILFNRSEIIFNGSKRVFLRNLGSLRLQCVPQEYLFDLGAEKQFIADKSVPQGYLFWTEYGGAVFQAESKILLQYMFFLQIKKGIPPELREPAAPMRSVGIPF